MTKSQAAERYREITVERSEAVKKNDKVAFYRLCGEAQHLVKTFDLTIQDVRQL